MLNWFEKEAPIRKKFQTLLIVYAVLSGLGLLATTMSAAGYSAVVTFGLGLTSFVAIITTTLAASDRICRPYVILFFAWKRLPQAILNPR